MHEKFPNFLKIALILKVILLIGVLLHYTGVLKFGERVTVAQESQEPEYKDATIKKEKKKRTFLDRLLNLPELDATSIKKEEVGRYMSLLEKKKQEIMSHLNNLQEREVRLLEIQKLVEDRLQKLDDEKRFFAETIQREKDLSGERTKQLVEFYKKMKPKKAAPVFEQLDKDLVVQMFNQLPQKQIMSILESMNPEKSIELTEYYGRVRSGREYDLLKEMNTSLLKEFEDCKTVR